MKYFFWIAFLSLPYYCSSQYDTLKLEGVYQGKNLLKGNTTKDNHFCIISEFVNGQELVSGFGSDLEINLTTLNLKVGDSLTIEIVHEKNCTPEILNISAIRPASSFNIVLVNYIGDSLIWETINEQGSLPFVVEQYFCDRWITIAIVEGVGTTSKHKYAVKFLGHSGLNLFRISQIDYTGISRYSDKLSYYFDIPAVTFQFDSKNGEIVFSSLTRYIIQDRKGNDLMFGTDVTVSCKNLSKGGYRLCFDNRMVNFRKK